jgi:hypothetical protein
MMVPVAEIIPVVALVMTVDQQSPDARLAAVKHEGAAGTADPSGCREGPEETRG